MEMVDDIWMDENEAINLASCPPNYSQTSWTKTRMMYLYRSWSPTHRSYPMQSSREQL